MSQSADVLSNYSIETMDTTMDAVIEPNPAYGDLNKLYSGKMDANDIDFKQNPAYGDIKGEVEYETVKPDLSVKKCIPVYETIANYY